MKVTVDLEIPENLYKQINEIATEKNVGIQKVINKIIVFGFRETNVHIELLLKPY